MDKYYYIVAQLPTLFFGKETSLTIDDFLNEAQKWMGVKDYNVLSQIDINDFHVRKKDHRVFQQYKNFESRLRTDVASWREAQKRDLDYKPSAFPVSVIKEGNPLDIELKLMQLKWDYIEAMERDHHFDLGFLILYYLKLQILQRIFTFNKEQGLEKFQTLYEVDL